MRRAVRSCAAASIRPCRTPAFIWPRHTPRPHARHESTTEAHAINHAPGDLIKPTKAHYAELIRENGNTNFGSAADVAFLLQELEANSLVPDSNVCHAAIRALAVHPDPFLLSTILEFMRESWLGLTAEGRHDIVVAQIKNAQLEEAMENLEAMRALNIPRQPWLLDMAVFALCDRGEIDEALALMQERVRAGEDGISQSAWYYLFDTACVVQHYQAIAFLWEHQVDAIVLNPSSGQCLAVLQTAARHADVPLATSVFSILAKRATSKTLSSIHYEMLMDTYLAVDDIRVPLTVLSIMSTAGIEATRGTTRNLYKKLVQGGPARITVATGILHELHEERPGRPIAPAAMNVVLEATIDAGINRATALKPDFTPPVTPLDVGNDPRDADLKLALQRFEDLAPLCLDAGGPTRETYTLLLRRCARAPVHKDAAVFLADEMVDRGIALDAATSDLLISACAGDALGLWRDLEFAGRQHKRALDAEEDMRAHAAESYDDAWRYYEGMRESGWMPTQGTMTLMIEACTERRDARLDDLKDAIKSIR